MCVVKCMKWTTGVSSWPSGWKTYWCKSWSNQAHGCGQRVGPGAVHCYCFMDRFDTFSSSTLIILLPVILILLSAFVLFIYVLVFFCFALFILSYPLFCLCNLLILFVLIFFIFVFNFLLVILSSSYSFFIPFFTPPIHCSRVFLKKMYIDKITEYHKVLIHVSMIRIFPLIFMYRSLTHTYRSPFYLLFCFIQYSFCLILALIHLQNHQFVPGLIDLFLSVCHINHEKIFTRIWAQKCEFVPF